MKNLTLVLCVLALLGSSTSAVFYFQIGNSKQLLEQQLREAGTRAAALEARAAATAAEKDQLQKRLSSVDDDLAGTKSRLTAASARAVQADRELAQVRTQLAARNPADQALEQELAALKRQLIEAKLAQALAPAPVAGPSPEELERLRQTVSLQEGRIADLQTQLASRPTIAALPPAPAPGPDPTVPVIDPEALVRADRTIAGLEERIRLLQREVNASEAREAAAVAAAGRAVAAAANSAAASALAAPHVAETPAYVAAPAPRPARVDPPATPAPARVALAAPSEAEPAPTVVLTARVRPTQVISVGSQNAFVVLNYGETQGARADQLFSVKRGTEIVATVQISDVRPNYSVAQVMPDTLRGALRKGDFAAIVAQ